ncbi:coiled-coil domain-containing protein [Blastopirellula retiformator]|uniref:Uncharacterized protein n=1 Tax=Blastopirellula retiformator TaxID=2527970 RepID=A0A5C5UYI6_9BACT|nr:hypothetical protein [Blastopirellula retiformator]TWT30720.1 hypothetical protein Enr8_42430 [Blastopirellula retiformator]
MTAPNAERFVRYTLTAMVDPSAKKTVTEFGAAFERTQKGMTATAKMEAKKRATNEEKERQAKLKAEEKAEKDRLKVAEREAKEKKRQADKEARDAESATAKRLKDEARAAKEEAEINAQRAREAERVAQAKIRAEQQAAAAAERESLRIARINFRANEVAKKQAADLARAREAAERRIRREHESTVALSGELSKRMTDGFLKAGEGIATMGRGLVALGIAGEEDLEKLVKTLARVQGIVELTKGGIETYRGLREGVDVYRRSVEAAAKAEAILAAIRGANSRGGKMPRGAGWESMGWRGMMGSGGFGGMAIGGGAATLAGAGAAAIAGVGFAGAQAAQSFNIGGSADRLAEAGWYDPGTLTGWLTAQRDAMSISSTFMGDNYDTIDAQNQARRSVARTGRLQKAREALIAQQQMDQQRAVRLQQEYDVEQQLRQNRSSSEDLLSQLGGPSPDAVMNRAQSAMRYADQQQAELARMRSGNIVGQRQQFSDGEVAVQEQRTLQAINDAVRLRRESLEIAKQTNREERDAAEQTIRKLNTQIEKQRQLQKESEDRLLSARERFGQLSEGEQKRAIAIKQKADASGYAALTREERAVLRGIGTEGAESIARQGDVAAANAAGFDQFFGGAERKKIKDAIAEQAKLEVEVKAQRQVVVKLEADDERLIEVIREQFGTLLEAQEQITEEKIKRALTDLRAEQNKTLKNSLPPIN